MSIAVAGSFQLSCFLLLCAVAACLQAACLAKCNGANVTLHRSGTFSLQRFRHAIVDTCTSGEEHLVVSVEAGTLFVWGGGIGKGY